jgi:hypothetical protein
MRLWTDRQRGERLPSSGHQAVGSAQGAGKALGTVVNDAGFREAMDLVAQPALAGRSKDAAEHLASVGVDLKDGHSAADLVSALTAALDRLNDQRSQLHVYRRRSPQEPDLGPGRRFDDVLHEQHGWGSIHDNHRLLNVWRSPEASEAERMRAITEFIPLGATASSVESLLGPGGKWWYLHGPAPCSRCAGPCRPASRRRSCARLRVRKNPSQGGRGAVESGEFRVESDGQGGARRNRACRANPAREFWWNWGRKSG